MPDVVHAAVLRLVIEREQLAQEIERLRTDNANLRTQLEAFSAPQAPAAE